MPPGPSQEPNALPRLLLGAGPSNVHPRVMRALTWPIYGFLDPHFIEIMDEIAEMLRHVFGSSDGFTLPISGTGSAGMEAGLVNLLEPGDVIVVAINGFFGERMAEIASRYGANVVTINTEWGKPIDPDSVRKELSRHPKIKALGVVQAETSAGIIQPLDELSKLAKEHDALFIVDAVASLGGSPVTVESSGIDYCFSATQKCLGAPPGLAPVILSEKALSTIDNRKSPARSWYFDLGLLREYWQGGTRVYHHTAPITNNYSLWQALRLILEEGLEERIRRHTRNGKALRAGLEALGLQLLVPDEFCAYQLTAVNVPKGVNEERVRSRLRVEHNIEISGGLGHLQGGIWRIGLMGESSTASNVLLVLSILETMLPQEGFRIDQGRGISAASKTLAESQ